MQTCLAKFGPVGFINVSRLNWYHVHTSIDQYTCQDLHSLTKPHLVSQYASWW